MFLEIQVVRNRTGKEMILHQKEMTKNILKRFNMYENVRTVKRPMISNDTQRKIESKEKG